MHFVIYMDMNNNSWCMMSMKPGQDPWLKAKPSLLGEWRGLHESRLSKVAGIEDCIFVHPTGYTGRHKTMKGALKMVQKTLGISQANNST